MSLRAISGLAVACVLGCSSTPPRPARAASADSASPVAKASPAAQTICSTSPHSATTSPDVVARVEVRGLARVPLADVCASLRMKAGADLDEHQVHDDVQGLWDSGLVDQVDASSEIGPSGRSLVYFLRERPHVRKWLVHGGPSAEQAHIAELLELGPGQVYDPETLREAVAKTQNELVLGGYRSASVQSHVETAPDNTVDIDVKVAEGPLALVEAIVLRGASMGVEADLRALVDTGGGAFNTRGKPYRADVLERDRYRINAYYYDHGMLQSTVSEEAIALSPDGTRATLTISIVEGPVYKIGKIRCTGDLAASEKRCLELLGAKTGEVFNRTRFSEGVERIRKLQDESHRSTALDPQTALDPKRAVVDLTIAITKPSP